MTNVTRLKPRSTSNLVVKVYPDGSFTSGRSQPVKADKGCHPLEGIASHETFYGVTKVSVPDRQASTEFNSDILERISLDYERSGNQELSDRFAYRYVQTLENEYASGSRKPDLNLVSPHDDFGDLPPSPLGLSDATISHRFNSKTRKKPATRGSKGITSKGKRMVRSCCHLLEKQYSKNCLTFLTATLPAFASPGELRLICSIWSELVRQFVQELKRMLERRGYPQDMVYVTEIQEDRYADRGEVAPHLHLVMVGKRNRWEKTYAIHYSEVRSLWERLLSNFVGRPVTCQAATRVERPRTSLQGEFSSYLSKGGKMIEKIIEDGKIDFLPSSWYGANQSLKERVKSETKILKGDEAEQFIDNLENMKQLGLLFYVPIIVYAPNLGKSITVGYAGWIREREVVEQFMAA